MASLRSTLRSHTWLAALALFAALLLRLAVPAGFMPVVGQSGVTLVPCSGYGPMAVVPAASAHTAQETMHGEHVHHGATAPHAGHGPAPVDSQAQGGCAFAELATPALPGADPIQLAAAIRYIVGAALFFPAAVPLGATPRLRPPLRGPPVRT